MKKLLFFLFPFFMLVLSCVPNASEEKLYHFSDLQHDLWKEHSSAIEQVFSFREDTVTTLVCEGGTKILIPAHAFVLEENPDKPIQGPVELRVLEVYQAAEMLWHHLSTQEKGGKLLESAGMIYLAAYAEGKVLRLKEGKEILLGFPKKEDFEEAALFSGTGMAGEALRWEKEESKFNLRKAIIDIYFGGDPTTNISVITAEEDLSRYSSGAGDTVVIDSDSYPLVLVEDENITGKLGLLKDYDDYFFFSIPQLSWINCDRFVEEEVTSLAVDISGFPQNTLYYLVFEDLNSLMVGYRKVGEPEEGNPVFEQVPKGQRVKLIVIFNKGGNYYLARKELVVEKGEPIKLISRKMPKAAIMEYLQNLGKAEELAASL